MLLRNQVYEELIEEVSRLKGKKVSDSGLRKIISEIVTGEEEEHDLKKFIEDGKINDKELRLLYKIIGIMEISETLDEFKKLRQKKKQKQDIELNDFEKVMKALVKVPKPEKEKKPPK